MGVLLEDALRGVAALFVVAFHLQFFIPNLHHGLGLLPRLDAFAGHHAVSGIFSNFFS